MALSGPQLRIVHAAMVVNPIGADARTVGGQDVAQLRQSHVGAVLRDQLRNPEPPASITVTARDLQHCNRAGNVAERDSVAAYYEGS